MSEQTCPHGYTKDDSPEAIWLSPPCDVHGDGRLWCKDPQEPCDECGYPWAKYVREDIALAKIAKLSDAMAPIWRIVNLYEGMDDERTAYVPLGMLRHIRRALEETA